MKATADHVSGGTFSNGEKMVLCQREHRYHLSAISSDARIAIEIKSAEEIQNKHLKNLKIFAEEHPQSRLIVVSLDVFTRRIGNIECLYVMDFFQKLWSEGL